MEVLPSDRLERESQGQYAFASKVGGVVPGYSGHRPGSQRMYFKSAFGGISAVGGGQRGREPIGGSKGHMTGQGAPGSHKKNPGYETTAWCELGTSWKPVDNTKVNSPNQQYLKSRCVCVRACAHVCDVCDS